MSDKIMSVGQGVGQKKITKKGEKPLIFESQDMKNHGINRKSVELKKVGQMSDSIDMSDRVGHLSDFVRLFFIESDGQVGHLSVRLVRLLSDSDPSPKKRFTFHFRKCQSKRRF